MVLKSKLLLMIAVLGLCLSVRADASSWYTGDSVNGRFWQTMGSTEKTNFLYGFYQGIYAMMFSGVLDFKQTKPIFDKYDTGLKYGEARAAIDRFYSDSSNAKVPIADAIEVETMKARGASPAEVENRTAYVRKLASDVYGFKNNSEKQPQTVLPATSN